jgi:large subunit ribosomal protein L4
LQRAVRNLAMVRLTTATEVTVYDIVKWQRVVLDVAAAEYFERTLSKHKST